MWLPAFLKSPLAPRVTRGEPKSQVSQPAACEGASAPRDSDLPRNYFDALSPSHNRTPIPTTALSGFSEFRKWILTLSRDQLAAIGEWLYDNDGICFFGVETICNYSAPVFPMAAGDDPEINKEYDAYIEDWAKRADFTLRYTFWQLQEIMCKSLDVHGDMGVVATDEGGTVQIQLVEAPLIGGSRLTPSSDGVVTDAQDRVIGYLVSPSYLAAPKLVSANVMTLVRDTDLYWRNRSLSPIRRGSNDARDARDIKGFEKTATKISSALAAVLDGSDGEEEEGWDATAQTVDGEVPSDAPAATGTATATKAPFTIFDLLGGDIPCVPDGKKFNLLKNERPGDKVMDFLGYLGSCFVYGLGLPPSFIIENDPGSAQARGTNGKAQRKFDKRQGTMGNVVEWTYLRVIADGIARGKLRSQDNWDKCEWQGPPKVSIDEGRDSQQNRDDVGKSLMTRQTYFANRQQNWKQQADQALAEDDYILGKLADMAKERKVPVSTLLPKWGYSTPTATPAAPTTTTDNKTNETPSPSPN